MKLKILGAHSCESANTKCTTILLDDIISFEASALTSSLTFEEQHKIEYILLSHQHYDHIKDIPLLGFDNIYQGKLKIFAPKETIKVIRENIFNSLLWLDLTSNPSVENPRVEFFEVTPLKQFSILNYKITPYQTNHSLLTVGYYVEDKNFSFFYTGDTGPGLENIWKNIRPNIIIVEVSLPNSLEKFASEYGHLCPSLFLNEIEIFKKYQGYYPEIIAIHFHPNFEKDIRLDLQKIKETHNISISISYEGMEINV